MVTYVTQEAGAGFFTYAARPGFLVKLRATQSPSPALRVASEGCTLPVVGEERDTLTIRQAATLLGVHPNTVRNRIKSGVYQAEKVVTERGETYIIPRSELDQHLTTNRVPSAPHSQSLPDVREAVQGLLEPFVTELGNVREERGWEKERREQAERRVEELDRQLGARQEPQITPGSAESRYDRVEAPEEPSEAQRTTGRPSWWRRMFGQ